MHPVGPACEQPHLLFNGARRVSMVLKPVLEAIDIWFRKVQPTLYAVPMPAFLLRHDCPLCLLGATACGVSRPADRGVPRQIRLSTEDRCHFGSSTDLAQRSLGRFRARFTIAAWARCSPTFSFARVPDGCACASQSGLVPGTSLSPWRRRSGAGISFVLCSPANLAGLFDVGSRPRMRSLRSPA